MPLLLCTAISSRTLALLLISIKSDQIKWNFNIGWQTATDNITALYRKTTTYDKAERYGQSMWCVYLAASELQIRHLQLLLLHQHTAREWRRRVQQCSGSWACGICRRLLTLLTTELQHQHTTPVAISYSSHQFCTILYCRLWIVVNGGSWQRMSDDQDGCEWVSVSSGTGLPG